MRTRGDVRGESSTGSMGPLNMGANEKRAEALRNDLLEGILSARFAPGASYPIARVAALLRATPLEIEPALSDVIAEGLITRSGDTITVAKVDKDQLVALFPRRRELELDFFRLAVRRSGALDAPAINDAISRMKRSALVGDLEGYMLGNEQFHREVKRALADKPEIVTELEGLRRQFRRAWCAFNRLRELSPAAEMRATLANALIAGNEEVAIHSATAFLTHLRESF
jgi:DNA-binding GntR family transcriptional regulator